MSAKNQAILNTQNAIKSNVSQTVLQTYINAENVAIDNYDKAVQTLNFLTNPDLALSNLNTVSEIINVQDSINKTDMINNMILYFKYWGLQKRNCLDG